MDLLIIVVVVLGFFLACYLAFLQAVISIDENDRSLAWMGILYLCAVMYVVKPFIDARYECVAAQPRSELCQRLLDRTGYAGK